MKRPLLALLGIVAAVTIFFWTDSYGLIRMWWQNDAYGTDLQPGPPYARPTPYPVIVHPHIAPIYPNGRPYGSPTPRPLPL